MKKEIKFNARFEHKASDCRTNSVVVEKIIEVSNDKFDEIMNNPLKDQKLIEIEKDEMYVDDYNNMHCILIVSPDREEGMLIESEGYNYARYLSIVPKVRQIVESDPVYCYDEPLKDIQETNKIRALVVEPGKKPYEKFISNTYESLKESVGGYLETYEMDNGVILVLNEEGKIQGLEPNRRIPNDVLVGTFIAVADAGEDFGSLSDSQFEYISERFEKIETIEPWEINTGITVVPWDI